MKVKKALKGVISLISPRVGAILDSTSLPPEERARVKAELQKMENDLLETQLDAQVKLHGLDVDDRVSARDMRRATKSIFPDVLAGFFVGAFVAILIIGHFWPSQSDDLSIADIAIYIFLPLIGIIFQFYYGGGSHLQKKEHAEDLRRLNGKE